MKSKSGNQFARSKRASRNNWKPYVDMEFLRPAQEEMIGATVQTGKKAAERLATASNLSSAEIRKLNNQVKLGRAARVDLFGPNIRLALQHAHSHNRGFLDINDLEIYAAHGLWRATDTYNPELGYRFTTYATPWIKSYLQRGRISERLIQLPEDVWIEVNAILVFQSQFKVRHHREPLISEVAVELGKTEARVKELLGFAQDPVYYDMVIGEDELTMGDLLTDDSYLGLIQVERSVEVDALLTNLTEPERRVILGRAGVNGTKASRQAVARSSGVSESAVRNIEKSALERLRELGNQDGGR